MNGVIEVDIKAALLDLLWDEEVKAQVLRIVEPEFEKRFAGGSEKNDRRLHSEIEVLKKEADQLREQLTDKEKEITDLKKELKQCHEEIQKGCLHEEQLQKKMEPAVELLDLWAKIQCIPERHRKYFNELSGADTIIAYFSIGRDWRKLEQLGKYMQEIAIGDAEDIQTMKTLDDLFCLCAEVWNYAKDPGETLKRLQIGIEDEFDCDRCKKTSTSRNSGRISCVLVQGFCSQDGKTKFPCIVRLS